MKIKERPELAYLSYRPRRILWKTVAGGEVSEIQQSDLVYDEHDFKIRQLKYTPSTVSQDAPIRLREAR